MHRISNGSHQGWLPASLQLRMGNTMVPEQLSLATNRPWRPTLSSYCPHGFGHIPLGTLLANLQWAGPHVLWWGQRWHKHRGESPGYPSAHKGHLFLTESTTVGLRTLFWGLLFPVPEPFRTCVSFDVPRGCMAFLCHCINLAESYLLIKINIISIKINNNY